VWVDQEHFDPFRNIHLGQVCVDRIHAGNLFEESGAVAIVEELWRRHPDVGCADAR
jgi:hypothetical protein